jgi:AraC family transcriptional regulator, alkane utilization regulator
LAREVGLSRSALVRRFGRMLNMSPIRYLATLRLHLAAKALREGSKPISAIADEVGYESEEGFSSAFKRYSAPPPLLGASRKVPERPLASRRLA